jgi:NitT/TauT family transport system substrate-binding protein
MKLQTSKRALGRGVGVLAGVLLAAPMLVACQSGNTEPDPEPGGNGPEEVAPVSFGVLRAPTGALAVIGEDLGWYEDAGVQVDFNSFAEGGGPAIIQAMGGGTPDIALLNLATTVLALGQNSFDVQIVSVGANPAEALPLIATADIQSVEDLAGKQVSTPPGGGQFYLLNAILNKHGMTLDDIDFRPLPVGEAQAAFLTGQLDAVISSANGAVIIENNVEGAHVLFDGTDFDEADGYSSPDVIIATRDAVESNPAGISRFLEAYHGSGVAYLNDSATRAEAIQGIQDYMESVGAGLEDIEATETVVDRIQFYSLDEARELLGSEEFRTAIQNQVDFLIDTDIISDAPDIDGALNTELLG